MVAIATTTATALFQICFNSFVAKFFFRLLQAYCISIPSLKFGLLDTYNYAYDLAQIILNQTNFITNKLRWMFVQNIIKMQWKQIIYSLSIINLSIKVPW